MSDYAALVATLHRCAERVKVARLTLGEVLDSLEEASFCFISIILTLPFLQPISLGPLATVGGLTFAALGWQLFRGHRSPVLPQKIRNTEMSSRAWEVMIALCLKIIGWCRRISRPRYTSWVTGGKGRQIAGVILISAGLLMAIPFFGIPFNNALPALAILFVCIGELEQDGVMVFIALGWLVITVVYFVLILLAIWLLGEQAIDLLR
jgi:Uncharacterized ABC-type transport system, permease components